jgi:hypothetical protein
MQKLPPDVQAQLDAHLQAVAEILYNHTETDKLQDFESIEVELRTQLLEKVAPPIGDFFSQTAANTSAANSVRSKPV